jgi:hypothetical protein
MVAPCGIFAITSADLLAVLRMFRLPDAVVTTANFGLYYFRMKMSQDAPRIFVFWLTRMKRSVAALR